MIPSIRQFLVIVLGTSGLSCLLGISLDLVTANVSVEYFSVHHPRLLSTENPWALAVFWGIAASWWFGMICGLIIAAINHQRQNPLGPALILRWAFNACVVLWVVMVAILVAVLAVASTIPFEKRPSTFDSDRRLVAVAMAHQYEYAMGIMACMVIAIKTWRTNKA